MLKKVTAVGLSVLITMQMFGTCGYALNQIGESSEKEMVVTDEYYSEITNMETMKVLIQYFGVDYFTLSAEESLAENETKAKISKMISEPNTKITNFDMINLLSDLVDVQERKLIKDEKLGINSNLTPNSNLINFFELGYLPNAEQFKPSSVATKEDLESVLNSMMGFVVNSEEDLENIPDDAETVTILKSGLEIENRTINANVFISPKAKAGVTFKNVNVNGAIEIAAGTDVAPVVIENTVVEQITMSQSAYETSVEIKGQSKVKTFKTKMSTKVKVSDQSELEKSRNKSQDSYESWKRCKD